MADDIRSRKKSFPVVYAFDHLEGEQLTKLRAIYGSAAMNDSDVAVVLALLDASGARAVAEDEAERHAGEAIDVIASLAMDPERRRDIEALASFFVHRSA